MERKKLWMEVGTKPPPKNSSHSDAFISTHLAQSSCQSNAGNRGKGILNICFTLTSTVMHQSASQKRSKSISALQFVFFQPLNTDMDTQSCKLHVCKKQAISEWLILCWFHYFVPYCQDFDLSQTSHWEEEAQEAANSSHCLNSKFKDGTALSY